MNANYSPIFGIPMRLALFGFMCAALVVCAGSLVGGTADEDWARIDELRKVPPPKAQMNGDVFVLTRDYLEEGARQGAAMGDALLEFIRSHPDDLRKWDAVVALTRVNRPVYKEIGDVAAKGWDAVSRDEAAESVWSAKVNRLVEQMIAAEDVSDMNREAGYTSWVQASTPDIKHAADTSFASSLAEFRRRIDVFVGKYPASPSVQRFEWQYLNRLRNSDPQAVAAHLDHLAGSASGSLAAWARGERNTESLRSMPMEMAFTAVDGREVDVAKLRGRVVLVDFWATWCGPCKAELPNVKRVYDAYHQKGFEVVAISLDRPGDRQKLVDYVKQKDLPWPQFFDGDHPKNRIAEQYGVMAIPSMFLLDQSGRLVTTNARGKVLEQEVSRLLGEQAPAG